MPSLDLFLFLEPTARNTPIPKRKRQPYISSDGSLVPFVYDLSLTVGHGQCTEAMFTSVQNDFYLVYDDPEALADCMNIWQAVNANKADAVKVMKYSKQPAVKEMEPAHILKDFGYRLVTESLSSSAQSRGRRALLETEDPRVLTCADSEGGDICNSLKRVASSAGYSLAFNSLQSAHSFTNQTLHREFYHTLLQGRERL